MSRLIHRAEEDGVKAVWYGEREVFLEGEIGYAEADKLAHYEDLEEQGRLIEVIRCKDCIRHGDEYEVGADGISWCDEHERLTDDDDYCSYAVAKLAEMEGAE